MRTPVLEIAVPTVHLPVVLPLFVSDSVNNNVRTYSAVGTTGTAAVLAGSAHGIIFDALTNTMLLTLYSPGQVLRLNGSGGVSIVAGGGALSALTVGVPATSVALNNIPFVAPDSAGGFYFAQQTQRVVSYVNVSGFLSRVVGNGTAGTGGDSGPASLATITSPFCIAMDATGAGYYVCDFGVGAIRYVTLASGTISTVAGVGSPGISGDGGPATLAKITGPVQVRTVIGRECVMFVTRLCGFHTLWHQRSVGRSARWSSTQLPRVHTSSLIDPPTTYVTSAPAASLPP